MRKSILLVLVAALALAVGFSATAGAGVDDGAQAAAKKGAKCKGKKGKAGKSTANAQAKKKGKGCKPKAQGAGLTDGTYKDASNDVELTLSGKGKTAALKFQVSDFCVPFIYESEPVTAKASNGGVQATESRSISLAGVPVAVTWTLNVTKSLTYSLSASLKPQDATFTSCEFSGTIKGTLAKG